MTLFNLIHQNIGQAVARGTKNSHEGVVVILLSAEMEVRLLQERPGFRTQLLSIGPTRMLIAPYPPVETLGPWPYDKKRGPESFAIFKMPTNDFLSALPQWLSKGYRRIQIPSQWSNDLIETRLEP